MMGFRNLELFSVNRILRLQVDFMLKILGKSQIIFVNTERILVFAQDVQVHGTLLELEGGTSVLFHPWIIFSSSLLESGYECLDIQMK